MVFLGNSPNGEDKHISRKNKNVHKIFKRGNKLKDLVENTYMLHSSPRLKKITEIFTNGCFGHKIVKEMDIHSDRQYGSQGRMQCTENCKCAKEAMKRRPRPWQLQQTPS